VNIEERVLQVLYALLEVCESFNTAIEVNYDIRSNTKTPGIVIRLDNGAFDVLVEITAGSGFESNGTTDYINADVLRRAIDHGEYKIRNLEPHVLTKAKVLKFER